MALYDLTWLQQSEDVLSTLFYIEYLSKVGFPMNTFNQLWNFVLGRADGGASSSGGGNEGAYVVNVVSLC